MIVNPIVTLMIGISIMKGRSDALPTTMEKMTISKMRMADLETSATGYVYNGQQGHPGSYVQYTNHGTGRYYDSPAPLKYVTYREPGAILHSAPSVILPGYKTEGSPLTSSYAVPLLQAPKKPALAPYYVPPGEVHRNPYHVEIQEDEDSSERDVGKGEEDVDDHEEHSEDSNAEEHLSRGENDEEGYEHRHEFHNGEKGEHEADRQEGHYNDEGGNTKSYSENAAHYDQRDEEEKGNEGESYSDQAYHKKGHKTTGFHKVYHKDEYKKDTDFYDNDHKSGHYEKYSSHDGHHSSADGGYKKGGQHDSGYENSERGKTALHDKGHDKSQHKGYKAEEGADTYHKNHAEYAKRNGAGGNRKYHYSNGYA